MDLLNDVLYPSLSWVISNPALTITGANGAVGWGVALRRPLWRLARGTTYVVTFPVWGTYRLVWPAPKPEEPFVAGLLASRILAGLDGDDVTIVGVKAKGEDGKPGVEQERLYASGAEVWIEYRSAVSVGPTVGVTVDNEDVRRCLTEREQAEILKKVNETFARLRQQEVTRLAERAAASMQASRLPEAEPLVVSARRKGA